MLKKIILYIISLILLIGIAFCAHTWFNRNDNIIYPLSKMKQDNSTWSLRITYTGFGEILTVSDQQLLFDNKKNFKITFDKTVYASTPAYFVRIYKDENEIAKYPLFYLEQIEFGTIPKP